ncbi:MAG UNVERIFIED_CONTAM: hypothetical protein LVR18_25325 [Planctomycetaceae bacterium]
MLITAAQPGGKVEHRMHQHGCRDIADAENSVTKTAIRILMLGQPSQSACGQVPPSAAHPAFHIGLQHPLQMSEYSR